jgi:hypothetical protein
VLPKACENIMNDKININNENTSQEYANKYSLSKLDHDLYHEEQDIANPVYRVKKVSMPNKGCKWKITLNEKVLFVIEGIKLSQSEKNYLETPAGFSFMLAQAKAGIKSLTNFRIEMKKILPPSKRGRPCKNKN